MFAKQKIISFTLWKREKNQQRNIAQKYFIDRIKIVAPNDFFVISNAVKIFSNQVTERGRNVLESKVQEIWIL